MGQITVHVVPGARSPALEFIPPSESGRSNLANAPLLKARLSERAEKGAANAALVRWLTDLSGLSVQIVRGHTSHRKTIAFAATPDEFLSALRIGLQKARPR